MYHLLFICHVISEKQRVSLSRFTCRRCTNCIGAMASDGSIAFAVNIAIEHLSVHHTLLCEYERNWNIDLYKPTEIKKKSVIELYAYNRIG